MNIKLFTYVHLDDQELLDMGLVSHFIEHYIGMGIPPENIYIRPFIFDSYGERLHKFNELVNKHNLKKLECINHPYDFDFAYRRYLELAEENKQSCDWYIKCDIDELISYGPYTLKEYSKFLNDNQYEVGVGQFVDCIDEHYILKNVNPNYSIFKQFERRAFITKKYIKGCNDKIVLFKPNVVVNRGHHHTVTTNHKIHYSANNKVFHFKWLKNLTTRIQINKNRLNDYEWSSREKSNLEKIIVGDYIVL